MAVLAGAALAIAPMAMSGAARADDQSDVGTVGGRYYGEMTISFTPPAMAFVLCHSGWDQVQVHVMPGNGPAYWTDVQYYNVGTGVTTRSGWLETLDRTDVGVVGPSPARALTGAVGTWQVFVQIGYLDAAGLFQATYNQWVPMYANMLPWQAYLSMPTVGTSCVVDSSAAALRS